MAVSEWLPHRCGWSGSSVAFDYHNFSPPPPWKHIGEGERVVCARKELFCAHWNAPTDNCFFFWKWRHGTEAFDVTLRSTIHVPPAPSAKNSCFFLPCFNFRLITPSYGSRNDPPFAPPLGPCGPGPPGGTAPLRRRALRGGPPPVGRRLLRPPRARRRPPPAQATGTPRTASHFKGRRVGEGVTGS